jgi:hypothetical protein
MSNEIIVRDEELSVAAETTPREILAQVVDAVRRDSQQSAAAFLAESTVPHGGE